MEILEYNDLATNRLKKKYDKVISMLKSGDFQSAEIKKLKGTPFYRAKLDHTNRLLFKLVNYDSKCYLLALEIIENHAYDKSRFLNGADIIEEKIQYLQSEDNDQLENIQYLNPKSKRVNLLDKIISFDDEQDNIYRLALPAIIIGSAGSGKTMLTLEKIKQQVGNILYITHSAYLVKNSRLLYYSNNYQREDQSIDFLSYHEFLETIQIPETSEVTFAHFLKWVRNHYTNKHTKTPNKLFEEFKGVLTGSQPDQAYLSKIEYLKLGIKQSIYDVEDRTSVYQLFEKYLDFLKEQKLHDLNILSFQYCKKVQQKYDVVIVDEIQDFTLTQLHLILSTLMQKKQFLLCGDSNQIVHPNFFSWNKIKSYFHHQADIDSDITRILTKNYRNSTQITELANRILKLKNTRFGSIDKESNYLVRSNQNNSGVVQFFLNETKVIQTINKKTKLSAKVAIVVLEENQKELAQNTFQTPLIFTVREAKGLEYENVILFNFISCESKMYNAISQSICQEDLQGDLNYSRTKDKTDKSLEIYKFYINSFYVAITRAVKNVYIVENEIQHRLFNILGIQLSSIEQFSLDKQESSLQEWQQEANKLEAQGKTEQAESIRKNIIHIEPVPWDVLTTDKVTLLKELIQKSDGQSMKKAKVSLLEYGVFYKDDMILNWLQHLKFKAAFNIKKSETIIQNKYFIGYNNKNYDLVISNANRYGINFKNPFNLTPLMMAAMSGNDSLIKELVTLGANKHLVNNFGCNAVQIALSQFYQSANYSSKKIGAIYNLLVDDSISIKVDGHLIKIDSKLMEFFLLNLIIAILRHEHKGDSIYFVQKYIYFSAPDLAKVLDKFPENVLLTKRKKRTYISSILSKNEINRQDPYNRKIFIRVKHGKYTLNPNLEVKISEKWINIYNLLQLEEYKPTPEKLEDPLPVIVTQNKMYVEA